MYQLIKQLHSFTAYIVLAVLIASVINALIGYFRKKEYFEVKDLRLSLFALVFSHIQMLLGFLVYVTTPRLQMWGEGAKVVMKDSLLRLLLLEHLDEYHCHCAHHCWLGKTQKTDRSAPDVWQNSLVLWYSFSAITF